MALSVWEFVCWWVLLPLVGTLIAVSYMSRRRPVLRSTTDTPMTQAFNITTIPGCNVLAMPPGIERISEIFVRLLDQDIVLQQVPAAFVASDVGFLGSIRGRPAWWQPVRLSEYLTIHIWPIPDDAYDLLFTQPISVGAARQNYQNKNDKSVSLLKSWLTPAQRHCFEEHSYFIVKGSVTGKLYRINNGINNGMVFNVEQLDHATGLSVRKLCFVPDNTTHPGDVMLAQKIMLETNEQLACNIANQQLTRGISPFPA